MSRLCLRSPPPVLCCPLFFLLAACSNPLLLVPCHPAPTQSHIFSPISSPSSLVSGSGGHTPRWNNSQWLYSHAPPRSLCPQVWNSITQPHKGRSTRIHSGGRQQRHQILSEISPPALRGGKRKGHGGVVKGGMWGFKKQIYLCSLNNYNIPLPDVCKSISLTSNPQGG